MQGCFTPSRGRRGAIEERRGPFGDPFRVKRPVSAGRMALPTPFETKRKKAPIGGLGRIQYLNVAEGMGLISNLLRLLSHCYYSKKGGRTVVRLNRDWWRNRETSSGLASRGTRGGRRSAMNLEHVLCDIDADDVHLSHGCSLLRLVLRHHEYGTSKCRREKSGVHPNSTDRCNIAASHLSTLRPNNH